MGRRPKSEKVVRPLRKGGTTSEGRQKHVGLFSLSSSSVKRSQESGKEKMMTGETRACSSLSHHMPELHTADLPVSVKTKRAERFRDYFELA
jgi:hypothetical protein